MENEENREGVTVGDVFRTVKRRIWYVLGAAVLFTVVVVLLLEFVVNPLLATYSMQFSLVFPTESDTYPDGSPFFYQDIVSAEFLTDAKNSDEAFSGINVDKMSKNADVVIEPETVTVNEVIEYTGRYTVTVQGSYFSGKDQAGEFIEALAMVPVQRMRSEAQKTDYASDEETFARSPFEERLTLLARERASLLAAYDGWIENFSETYSVRLTGEDGKTSVRRLKDLRDSVAALYGESVQEELQSELEFGGYYSGDLAAYIARLTREYEQNVDEIAKIQEVLRGTNGLVSLAATSPIADSAEASSPDLSRRLTELITRNNRIDHWVNASGTVENPTLNAQNVEAFSARLDEEFAKLNKEAAVLTDVIGAIYARGMSVRFDVRQADSSGDIGTVVSAVASFVGGLIIASIVVYIVENNRRKKAEAAAAEEKGQ